MLNRETRNGDSLRSRGSGRGVRLLASNRKLDGDVRTLRLHDTANVVDARCAAAIWCHRPDAREWSWMAVHTHWTPTSRRSRPQPKRAGFPTQRQEQHVETSAT